MKPDNRTIWIILYHEFVAFVRDNKPLMYNEENDNKIPQSILRIMKESLGWIR